MDAQRRDWPKPNSYEIFWYAYFAYVLFEICILHA